MYRVSLSRIALAAEPVGESPAPSSDASPAASQEPNGGSPGALLQSLAAEPVALTGLATTRESSFETRTVSASEDRLSKLTALLDSLKTCRRDLETQIHTAHGNRLDLLQAAQEIRSAIESDKPIPQSLLPILGSVGLLGMMTGLAVAPILGLFGISIGVSATYKERAQQVAAELDRQAAQQGAAAEALQQELDDVDRKIDSVLGQITRERARLEEAAQPAHERAPGRAAMVRDPGWYGVLGDRELISSSTPVVASATTISSRELLLHG